MPPQLFTTHTDDWINIMYAKNLSQLEGITFASVNVRSLFKKMDDILVALHASELKY